MTLLIVTVYISGFVYAAKCYKRDRDADVMFFTAFFGLFFIPILIYYIEYYTIKKVKDDSDLLNAILSHGEIDDNGTFSVGGEKIGIYDDHVSIGNAMNIEFSKEALDKIRKQYLLLKITK